MWAWVLGIFALGIPVSSAGLVRSSVSRGRLHQLATTVIRDELGLRAAIGSVQLQLVPLSLVARDITLDDPIYGRVADADELRIRPSFRALLRGGLDLRSITIRRADLRLVVRNGQVRNLPGAEAPSGGGGPPTLPFDELRVVDSTLTMDAEPYASGQLRHVDLFVRSLSGGIRIEASSRDGWVRHRRGREHIALIDGHVEVTQELLQVSRLTLQTPELRLSVRDGEAPMTFGPHGYEGRVELSYDLSHLARLPLPDEVTLPPFSGRVTIEAQLESDGERQRAQGTIDTHRVQIDRQWGTGERGHIVFSATPERVEILDGSTIDVMRGGGSVAVAGTIGLSPEEGFPVDVTADVTQLSFARLMATLSVTDNAIVEWFFNGQLRLRGTLVPLDLSGPVRLRTHDFRVSHEPYHAAHVRRVIGVHHGDFEGSWSIRPDAVRFYDLVGVLPRSRLRGSVHLGFDNQLGVHATADVDLADLSPLDRWPIEGVGTARCDIDGTFNAPNVTGHVQMEGFVFDDFRLGNVESDAQLDPDGLGVRFAMVSAVKRDSRYRAEDLYLDFHDDRFAMTGLLHLDGMLLADFYHVFGFEEDERFAPYQGLAQGQANLRYTNGFPDDSPSGTLDVDLNLGFDWAELNDYRFEDGQLVGRWRWLDWDRGVRGAELSIAHLSLRKGEGTVTLDGRMSLGGELSMNAAADRIALSELEGIRDRFPGVEGVATAVGRVGGAFDVMRAEFDVGVTNVTYEGRSLGDGRFYVRMADREDPYVTAARAWDRGALPNEPCAHARIGLAYSDWPPDPPVRTVDGPQEALVRPMAFLVCGSALDDRLRVDLAVGRTQPLPVRGVVELANLDLSPFLPSLPDRRRVEGAVRGQLTLNGGALRRPETLEGRVDLDHVRFAAGDLEVQNRRPVDLTFDDGVLAVNRARFVGPDSRLRVRGRASLEDGLALQVDAGIDLGLASRVSESIAQARGRVDARLNISGPIADPELYGQATIENGAFEFADFPANVENLQGRVRFSQRSVLFESFEADVAGGHIEASGAAELREQSIQRYALTLNARDLAFDFTEGVDAGFGARTRLTWNRGDRLPTLSGELRVDRFDYTRPIELRSLGDIAASAVRGAFRSERTEVRRYDPERDLVDLDLRVVQRAPFRIRNNLIEAQMRIRSEDRQFRIVGTDQRFGVQGTMDITQGSIVFQNNEFEVRRGAIDFDDTTRIDPRVNVEAVTQIRRSSDLSSVNWRIWLTLTGASDNLRLSTRSEPELPEPDILMLLAFGMTRAELQQLQQGGDLASAAALEAITSVTGVDREIRRALPLIDDFRLTTGYSARTQRSEPRLSVGKRIAERVRLSATTGLGEGREFRGGLEFQLDDNQRVGVSYDNYNVTGSSSFGNLGVDWGYRLEFE